VLTLEKMGFEVEAAHHEVAPGQHEVDFKYANALRAADNIQIFKLIVKTIARQNGYYATFMPKPISGINGNGMHTNMSLFKDGENVFEDKNDGHGLSTIAYEFLGGLLEHATNFTAITNPTVNSYKRLTPGFEAPVYVAWSASNRSPMIRIPASRGKSTRLELRAVDPTANPYLAFSAILASGLDGIEKKVTPKDSVDQNIFLMDAAERAKAGIKDLPETLNQALTYLQTDAIVKDAIGNRVADTFIEAKRLEYDSYRQSISEWEIERYLDLY
jgi:glutamine synthetase